MSAPPMPTMREARKPPAVLPACALAPLPVASVPSAHAITLIVDSGADAASDICADAVAGDCTPRGAILAANARTGADRIVFDIPTRDTSHQAATAQWRLTPAADLPTISDDLEIDGYSQPDARENGLRPDQGGSDALIEIELAGAPGAQVGLYAVGGNPRLTVRGLAINGFVRNLLLYAPAIVAAAAEDGGATIALSHRVDSALAHAAYPLRVAIGSGAGGQPDYAILTDLYPAADAQTERTVRLPAAALLGRPLALIAVDADGNNSEVASEAIYTDDLEP